MAEDLVIGLADAVGSLRAELEEAQKKGAGQELQFRVGPVELEFQVQVARESGADGGVRFWVVSLQGRRSSSEAATHRVKLTLLPVGPDGEDVIIRDEVPGRPK